MFFKQFRFVEFFVTLGTILEFVLRLDFVFIMKRFQMLVQVMHAFQVPTTLFTNDFLPLIFTFVPCKFTCCDSILVKVAHFSKLQNITFGLFQACWDIP